MFWEPGREIVREAAGEGFAYVLVRSSPEDRNGQGWIRTSEGVKPADLQSAPFGHSGTYPFASVDIGSRSTCCKSALRRGSLHGALGEDGPPALLVVINTGLQVDDSAPNIDASRFNGLKNRFRRIVACPHRPNGRCQREGIGGPSSESAQCRTPRRRADLQQVEREPISTLAKG